MPISQKITPFLWFDHQAEEAAQFYTAIFPNSQIINVTRYAESDHESHQGRAGTAMTVAFALDGQCRGRCTIDPDRRRDLTHP